MTPAPAFQFYPHDFLSGRVATYSLESVGAYILLLSFDWTLDGLPYRVENSAESPRESLEKLAKICRVSLRRFEKIWAEIGDQFEQCADGKLRNRRLQSVREKQLAYSQSMSENGKRGGRPKKPQESHGLAAGKPEESTPSPTPSPKHLTTANQNAVQGVLDYYLSLHPRRRIGPKDRKAVAAALTMGYSATELAEAIEGNAKDDWHREKHKHELPYVLRDTGKIDDFRAKAEAAKQPLVDPTTGLLTPAAMTLLGKAS
jgi:uncharacterized protein YdaU (DUF1376 family)